MNIGAGAMIVYGGCSHNIDLKGQTNPLIEMHAAINDIYVLHLAGEFGDSSKRPNLLGGEGLWVKVPGDCGLGNRVCPSATAMCGVIIIFGGIRGNDLKKKQLSDARIVRVSNLLASLKYVGDDYEDVVGALRAGEGAGEEAK